MIAFSPSDISLKMHLKFFAWEVCYLCIKYSIPTSMYNHYGNKLLLMEALAMQTYLVV